MSRGDYAKDRLGDYVEVKDRIRMFYEAHPDGRLVTSEVRITNEPDGTPRVWVEALAFRTADDPHPARGWSWMVLPGVTPYTKGSELENTETSAWGRAIGALGIGIDRSIASANEVRAKGGEEERAETRAHAEGDGLVGTAEAGKDAKAFEVQQTPTGHVLSFRLRGDRGGIKVEAHDAHALAIAGARDAIEGQRVTVWGRVEDKTFTPKGQSKPVTYQVLTLSRLHGPDIEIPATVEQPSEPLPWDMDAVDRESEMAEALSA